MTVWGRAPSPVHAEQSSAENNLPDSYKLAIVAALEREVRPLVKNWRIVRREYEGHRFNFFERDGTVVVCGGIGAQAACRATEAVCDFYHPALILSVGFAGALGSTLKVGNIFLPRFVIDANDGSKVEMSSGTGTLLTVSAVAGANEKASYLKDYGAAAIDMEAAAVARAAQSHSIPFMAVKAISDEYDFDLPPMERFVSQDGQFRTAAFGAFIAIRPWLWARTVRLAGNSAKASRALCSWLDQYHHDAEKLQNSAPELHPTEGASSQTTR
jgi:adenosylhomocysteine nucleosidase